jgi:nicotinate-nucleotide adenylyltransferase
LNMLRKLHPEDEFYLIMGSDSFADFRTWKEYSSIFSCCNIVIIGRPGTVISLRTALPVEIAHEFIYHEDPDVLSHSSGHSVFSIEGTKLDISSTAIRSLIREGRSIKYLVPYTVEEYIKQQRLYDRTQ